MLLDILKMILYIASTYVLLATGCEYRNYGGGHRVIKAFRARTWYQQLFTLLQCEKDIDRRDMGKLTYLGYAGVLLATVSGILGIAPVVYLYVTGREDMGELVFSIWAFFGMAWGICALLIQGVDSVINRFFGKRG